MFGKLRLMEHLLMNYLFRLLLQVCKILINYLIIAAHIKISSTAAEYNTNKPRSIIVREGEHLRLRCAANGNPPPKVEWIRQDERAISFGAWELSSVSGEMKIIKLLNQVL